MFFLLDDKIYVSLEFLFFCVLVLFSIGVYMRGVNGILKGYRRDRKKMNKFSSTIMAIIDTIMMPVYVASEVVSDIFFMWRR